MRKNKCIDCWTSYPSNHEMLLWGGIGIIASLTFTGLAAIGML
mgnify:FL=1